MGRRSSLDRQHGNGGEITMLLTVDVGNTNTVLGIFELIITMAHKPTK